MKQIVAFFSLFLLVGCHTTSYQTNKIRQPFDITHNEKRLNTADCKDSDDWYLDGFRVGKSYRAYKQKMFLQRVSFCETSQPVSEHLKSVWEQGYNVSLHKK